MNSTPNVTFRVDASRETGLGHLRRCLTLADELRDAGCKVRFVCRDRFRPVIAPLLASHTVCWLDGDSRIGATSVLADEEHWDADATLSVIGRDENDTSWMVVDSYCLGHRWERSVRDAGHRIMVIDDVRDRMHHADLLVSDSEIPFDPAFNERSALAKTLVGREYALIGPDYVYSHVPVSRRTGPKRLLVSYGGSDPTGETMKAINAVRSLRGNVAACDLMGRVDVAVGQLNPMAEDIARAAHDIQDIVVHMAPLSLATLMEAADLVLTAGGNTMVEAMALRRPCLVTVTGDNQALMVGQLAAEKMIRSLGAQHTVAPVDVEEAIVDILTDFEVFTKPVASRRLFDNLGAKRIAAEMLRSLGLAFKWPEKVVRDQGDVG